jgi:hypothetical protein
MHAFSYETEAIMQLLLNQDSTCSSAILEAPLEKKLVRTGTILCPQNVHFLRNSSKPEFDKSDSGLRSL